VRVRASSEVVLQVMWALLTDDGGEAGRIRRPSAICIATMLDFARLKSLERIVDAWSSEVAAAVLANAESTIGSIQQQRDSVAHAIRSRNSQARVHAVLVDNTG